MRQPLVSLLGLVALPASLLLPIPGCGGRSQNPPSGNASPTTGGTPTSSNVGASGGDVVSADGRFELKVPANAIPHDVTLTIAPSSITGAVGAAYDVSPAGLELKVPVTMTLHMTGVDLGGARAADLRIGTYVNGRWQALSGYTYDAASQTITARSTKLAPFGATAHAQVCLARSGQWTCPGSGSSSGSSSGGGSSSGSSGAATPPAPAPAPTCPPPTCAEINPCADVPMATKTDCEIDPDTGSYQATCCYDPSVPYCVTWGGGSSGGLAGDCAPPPPPAPPCDSVVCDPGATLQSCTNDTPNSFTATCCYPSGVIPDPGSSSSGSGSSSGSSSGGNAAGGSSSGSSTGSSGGSSGSSSGTSSGSCDPGGSSGGSSGG